MKKRILIIGPLGDFGGREIEARTILVVLSSRYDLKLLSYAAMTQNSIAVKDLECNWTTVTKEIFKSNFIIRVLSIVSKKVNQSDLPAYFLVNNKWSRNFFDFNRMNSSILKKEIDHSDLVLFCGILAKGFLNEVAPYCVESKKPLILRTTGTIQNIPKSLKKLLPTLSSILVHSKSNAVNLINTTTQNVKIIDQTTLSESALLSLPIQKTRDLKYGFIGRFASEKGIVELLKIFKTLDAKLVVAGSGPLLIEVEKLASENCILVGEIKPENLASFFGQIDVLIIPSLEEAGPLVGIEAMAAGKLVFSTKVGAMQDRLSETKNDFWFDIEVDKSLEKLIKKVENSDPDSLVAIREINRKVYLEKYSIEKIFNSYIQLVEDVLNTPKQ